MAKFKLKSVLRGYKRILGMSAEIYNESGDLLNSVDIERGNNRFLFQFDQSDALLGKRKNSVTIKLVDNNSDRHNFIRKSGSRFNFKDNEQIFTTSIRQSRQLKTFRFTPKARKIDLDAPVFSSGTSSTVDENIQPATRVYDAETTDASTVSYNLQGTDSESFTIDPTSGAVSIKQSPDFESKSTYSIDIIATDANENSSTQSVTINVNDIEEGQTINLTPLLDNITAKDHLTLQNDSIQAELGTLGQGFTDSIADASKTDDDLLVITTNANFDIVNSLDQSKIHRIQNIETIRVIAKNDDVGGGVPINLGNIVNLKNLDLKGTFTNRIKLLNWSQGQATSFDFSGITSSKGVNLLSTDASDQTIIEPFTLKGSPGDDKLQGLSGNVTIQGLGGNDTIIGSTEGISVVEGGDGTDTYNFKTHDAQHTIRLHGQISETSRDSVAANTFQGFNNANAKVLKSFDLIEIDAATFTNHTANKPVQQKTLNNIIDSTNLSNTVVTAETQAELEAKNLDNNGDAILGFAADTGTLLFSASGNFNADAQELLNIGATEGVNFEPVQQINVV